MIYLFWIIMTYLLCCIIFGAYAHEMIERFDVPYKQTELEKKSRSIKDRYTEWSLRYLSQ